MRKFTTRIYTKANYLLNRGRMALSNQRGDVCNGFIVA